MIYSEIRNLPAALAESLNYLNGLLTDPDILDERDELTYSALLGIIDIMCSSVTDWSEPRPRMPLSSWQAWAAARKLVGVELDYAWEMACDSLKRDLKYGYAAFKEDLA